MSPSRLLLRLARLASRALPAFIAGVIVMSATAAPLDAAEIRKVISLLLNHPSLSAYYHFDVRPQRIPLKVVNQSAQALDLAGVLAAGKPTELASAADRNSLVIKRFSVDAGRATLVFEFLPEGVLGTAQFIKVDGSWKLDELELAER
jgi:hypothetical protein